MTPSALNATILFIVFLISSTETGRAYRPSMEVFLPSSNGGEPMPSKQRPNGKADCGIDSFPLTWADYDLFYTGYSAPEPRHIRNNWTNLL